MHDRDGVVQMKNDLLFKFASLAIGSATAGVFVLMNLKGAVYVYENIKLILYIETAIAFGYAAWSVERFIKAVRVK